MVVVILVNFNNANDTIDCVLSILKSNYTNYIIVVIDNCSTDSSYQVLHNDKNINNHHILFCDSDYLSWDVWNTYKIFVIQANRNFGFAGGNNLGIEFIRKNGIDFDYIWLLNNDTIIEENTLRILVERIEFEQDVNSKLGILGCKLFRFYQPDKLQGVGGIYNKLTATCKQLGEGELDTGQYNTNRVSIDYPIGASLFVRKDFIDAVGLMQEDYFLYFEELDWVIRGKRKGFDFGFEYRANVFHKEGGSTKASRKRLGKVADHCQIRNRILFTYRYYPMYLLTVIPITFGSVINRILRGQFTRALELTVIIFRTSFGILFKKYE